MAFRTTRVLALLASFSAGAHAAVSTPADTLSELHNYFVLTDGLHDVERASPAPSTTTPLTDGSDMDNKLSTSLLAKNKGPQQTKKCAANCCTQRCTVWSALIAAASAVGLLGAQTYFQHARAWDPMTNWSLDMGALKTLNGWRARNLDFSGVPIAEMAVVSAHDSGTGNAFKGSYDTKSWVDSFRVGANPETFLGEKIAFGVTQSQGGVWEQLMCGARVLDTRLWVSGGIEGRFISGICRRSYCTEFSPIYLWAIFCSKDPVR